MRNQVWGHSVAQLTISIDDPVRAGYLPVERNIDVRSLVIRPILGRDHGVVEQVRRDNWEWLSPWEATLPPGAAESLPDLATYRRRMDRRSRNGEVLLMMVEVDGEVAGQVSVTGVQRGAMSSGALGYWMGKRYAGRGIGSLAVALVIDLVIGRLGLHRIEVNVRPENGRSLGLCGKLGLREEGLRVRFMNIAGVWADHRAFAIDAEMLPAGGLVRSVWNV